MSLRVLVVIVTSLGKSTLSILTHFITSHDQRGRTIVYVECACIVAQLNGFQFGKVCSSVGG